MKKILVINPVTDTSVHETASIYVQQLVAGGDFAVDVVRLSAGPASIETFFDEAYAAPMVVDLVVKNSQRYDGVVVNCFADPGVEASRELVDIPVVGPGEASMLLACTLGHKFAVVSTFRNGGPWAERQARALGIEGRLASASGVDIHVRDLNADPETTLRAITSKARAAVENDGAEVIVLGCTGMAPVAGAIRHALGIPVVEPTAAALGLLEAILDLGLRHSKAGAYSCPTRR